MLKHTFSSDPTSRGATLAKADNQKPSILIPMRPRIIQSPSARLGNLILSQLFKRRTATRRVSATICAVCTFYRGITSPAAYNSTSARAPGWNISTHWSRSHCCELGGHCRRQAGDRTLPLFCAAGGATHGPHCNAQHAHSLNARTGAARTLLGDAWGGVFNNGNLFLQTIFGFDYPGLSFLHFHSEVKCWIFVSLVFPGEVIKHVDLNV